MTKLTSDLIKKAFNGALYRYVTSSRMRRVIRETFYENIRELKEVKQKTK